MAGLPRRVTEDVIRQVFGRFGIQHVNLIRDLHTNISKCFCYIMFESGKGANEAIETMNKRPVFNEWLISVEHAKLRMLPDDPRIQQAIRTRKTKKFVKNVEKFK